jgi:hypothetical protein
MSWQPDNMGDDSGNRAVTLHDGGSSWGWIKALQSQQWTPLSIKETNKVGEITRWASVRDVTKGERVMHPSQASDAGT